ncbi:sensor domain-containing diguanylate cyclase [Caballeronia calidae]|uniref:sensor domain-containing diguanylate cyclase n=1 Tax=Caballeronia calidae TaxID=1777139 RepID=UPI0007895B4A
MDNNCTNPSPNAPTPSRPRFSAPNIIVLCGTVIALAMVGLCALVLYQGRLDALERARDTSRNLALLAERDIERNFELYELSLQAVVEGVHRADVSALPPQLRNDVLFDRAATARDLGSILVLDVNGNIVIDSGSIVPRPANFADRRYFTVQRDHPDTGLFISSPFASRLRGGAPSIALSRRLSNPDGSFAGVAMLAINLEYFRTLFAGLSLGPHGAVSLISQDGMMIMRQPFDAQIIGRDITHADTYKRFRKAAQGSFSETSSLDGRRRLYYFRNFPKLPLIIMVAEGEEDVYAAWHRRAVIIGSSMGVLAIGFIILSFVLAAQFRRRMRAESELQLLARTDGLTGLHNRRTLGEILDQEWRRARRTRSLFSLLFVDIDRFKAFNDAYGHQAGDDALAAVARCIGDNIRRPADTAARYGGEEFIVVLPDTPTEGAARIAERIRAAISDLSIEHAGSEFGRVTASIGLASWRPERDDDVSTLIRAADEALYDAKASGRNRVMQAGPV